MPSAVDETDMMNGYSASPGSSNESIFDAPSTSVPAPIPVSSPEPASASGPDGIITRPRIAILELNTLSTDTNDAFRDFIDPLYARADVLRINTVQSAVNAFVGVPFFPDTVVCADTSILSTDRAEDPPLNIVEAASIYVRRGGKLIILGMLFSYDFNDELQPDHSPPDINPFFSYFGLPWRVGVLADTISVLNADIPNFDITDLAPSHNQRAFHLQGVPYRDSIYLPSEVLPLGSADEASWPQACVARVEYGIGKIYYVGNATPLMDGEDVDEPAFETRDLLLRMCELG